jgi:hypothetical protein
MTESKDLMAENKEINMGAFKPTSKGVSSFGHHDTRVDDLEYEAKLLDYHIKQAKMLCKVEFVPKDYRGKEANALFAIQMGHHVGLSPTQALQTIAVINGKAALYGDGLLAAVRGSGLCEWIKEDVEPGVSATCTTLRKGEKDPVSRTFTMELAETAGLIARGKDGSPWKTYPDRMMQMRARAWCLRDVYADALMGIQSAEEIRDIEDFDQQQLPEPEVNLLPKHLATTDMVELQLAEPIQTPAPVIRIEDATMQISLAEDLQTLIQIKDEMKGMFEAEEDLSALSEAYATRKKALKSQEEEG